MVKEKREFEIISHIRLIKGANTFRQFKIEEAYITDVANRSSIFRYCTRMYKQAKNKKKRKKHGGQQI